VVVSLSSWRSHCKSSPGLFDDCSLSGTVVSTDPQTKPTSLGCMCTCRLVCSRCTVTTYYYYLTANHTTTVLQPFFQDHPGEPVPEKNFWILWCKGRLTEADTLTIWLGDGLHSIRTNQCLQFTSTIPPYYLTAKMILNLSSQWRIVG